MTLSETYQAMCRQCGDIIQHRLDRADALPCALEHPVAPTIARAALFRLAAATGRRCKVGQPKARMAE